MLETGHMICNSFHLYMHLPLREPGRACDSSRVRLNPTGRESLGAGIAWTYLWGKRLSYPVSTQIVCLFCKDVIVDRRFYKLENMLHVCDISRCKHSYEIAQPRVIIVTICDALHHLSDTIELLPALSDKIVKSRLGPPS